MCLSASLPWLYILFFRMCTRHRWGVTERLHTLCECPTVFWYEEMALKQPTGIFTQLIISLRLSREGWGVCVPGSFSLPASEHPEEPGLSLQHEQSLCVTCEWGCVWSEIMGLEAEKLVCRAGGQQTQGAVALGRAASESGFLSTCFRLALLFPFSSHQAPDMAKAWTIHSPSSKSPSVDSVKFCFWIWELVVWFSAAAMPGASFGVF